MSLAERLGSRKGFIRDVSYIGNGKLGYKKHIQRYNYTQKALNKKRSRPAALNLEPIPTSTTRASQKSNTGNTIYLEYIERVREYKDVYGNIEDIKEIETVIQNLRKIERLQHEVNSNIFVNGSKYTKKIEEYRKIYETNIEDKLQKFEEQHVIKPLSPKPENIVDSMNIEPQNMRDSQQKLLERLHNNMINKRLKSVEKSLSEFYISDISTASDEKTPPTVNIEPTPVKLQKSILSNKDLSNDLSDFLVNDSAITTFIKKELVQKKKALYMTPIINKQPVNDQINSESEKESDILTSSPFFGVREKLVLSDQEKYEEDSSEIELPVKETKPCVKKPKDIPIFLEEIEKVNNKQILKPKSTHVTYEQSWKYNLKNKSNDEDGTSSLLNDEVSQNPKNVLNQDYKNKTNITNDAYIAMVSQTDVNAILKNKKKIINMRNLYLTSK